MPDGVAINWGMLGNFPNAGAAFAQGLELGHQRRQETARENALAAYAANPDDSRAIGALTMADPRAGLAAREDMLRRQEAAKAEQAAKQKAEIELFGRAAQAAHDAPSWDLIVDHLSQQYPDVAQYKGKYDPGLRASLMAQAGLTDAPDKQTAMQQNFEWLKTQDPKLADQYLHNQAEGPPIVVDNGDGTRTIYPRSQLGMGAQPAPAQPQAPSAPPPGRQHPAPTRGRCDQARRGPSKGLAALQRIDGRRSGRKSGHLSLIR